MSTNFTAALMGGEGMVCAHDSHFILAAETPLEQTRIQLGLERQWGGVWRSKPDLPPIPEDIRRFIASRCHPDHNQDSDIATKAMAWLNGQPREERQ